MNEWRTLSFSKNIYIFILLWKASVGVWETGRWMEMKTACHIDPELLLLLTILWCVIFKALLSTSSSASQLGVLQCRLSVGRCPSRMLSMTAHSLLALSWDWLKTHTDRVPVSHVGICIYHFITAVHFQDHMTASAYFHGCILCRESLIAWSRVNMQHFCWSFESDEPNWTVRCQAHLLLFRFASMVWNTILEFMVLSRAEFAQSLRFLQPEWNFLNHLVPVLWSNTPSPLAQQIFLVVSMVLWPSSNL